MIKELEDYMMRESKESIFIYSLDKLLPIINIELNNNDFYLKSKTTYKKMLEVKEPKIKVDSTVYKYFTYLAKYLNEDAKFFWPENKYRDYTNKYYNFVK